MDDDNWTNIWTSKFETSGVLSVHLTIPDVSNQSNFRLKFWTDLSVTSSDEVCSTGKRAGEYKAAYIDNIEVSDTPIPEPTTLLLFVISLAGFASYE